MQLRDSGFAAPLAVMDQLITAFLTRLTCLVGRPPPIFNFERCEGHLPLARSDRYQASKSRAPIIQS